MGSIKTDGGKDYVLPCRRVIAEHHFSFVSGDSRCENSRVPSPQLAFTTKPFAKLWLPLALLAGVWQPAIVSGQITNWPWTFMVTNGAATITAYSGPGGDVVIPASLSGYPVTKIGRRDTTIGPFRNNLSVTSITVPDSVEEIGPKAFYRCYSMTNITLGTNVRIIAASGLSGLTNLTEITLPENLEVLESQALMECVNLVTVRLGGQFREIGASAFRTCRGLTSIVLPASVQYIGDGAFAECSALEVLFLGSAPQIAGQPFPYSQAVLYRIPAATNWGNDFAGRPVLVFEPKITGVNRSSSGLFSVSWTGTSGTTWARDSSFPISVESRESLAAGAWEVLARGITNGEFSTNSLTNGSGFFRLIVP
jgi:hypothetical protein